MEMLWQRAQLTAYENAAMKARIRELDAKCEELRSTYKSSLEKYVACDAELRRVNALNASEAAAKDVLIQQYEKELTQCRGELAAAKRTAAVAVTSSAPPAANTSHLTTELESFQRILEEIHRGVIALQPCLADHETLVLWDIENVGLPPNLSAERVSAIVDEFITLTENLIDTPHKHNYKIIAAHNPCSRDATADEFYVQPHVATALTEKGITLLNCGGKKGAADLALQHNLNDWLRSTAALKDKRAVVFVTGDGDFTGNVRNARSQGCLTALIYRCEKSVKATLKSEFKPN